MTKEERTLLVDLSGIKRKDWYAVKCKPRQERLVVASLARVAIDTFFPRICEQKLMRGKVYQGIGPLFPGYLFVKFDVKHDYRIVRYTRGVQGVVSFGIAPAVVDEELIRGIQGRMENGYVKVLRSLPLAGQTVKLRNGPMHGIEAVFERPLSGYHRAVLLLRAISYHAKLVVDLKDIVNL